MKHLHIEFYLIWWFFACEWLHSAVYIYLLILYSLIKYMPYQINTKRSILVNYKVINKILLLTKKFLKAWDSGIVQGPKFLQRTSDIDQQHLIILQHFFLVFIVNHLPCESKVKSYHLNLQLQMTSFTPSRIWLAK